MAWRDEMQGETRSQGLFSLTSGATRQFARQTPSHRACFAPFQRGGCNQIARSLRRPPWHRSLGYDLRRSSRDHRNLVCNAARGGVNQRFLRFIGAVLLLNVDSVQYCGWGKIRRDRLCNS